MDAMRILVVEDSTIQFSILSSGLKRLNIDCTHARSFTEALSIIRSDRPFSCILSDVSLPCLKIEDFLKEIARIGNETPILIYTANTSITADSFDNFRNVCGLIHKPACAPVIGDCLRNTANSG
jgi:DNA-binding NtrC family response regulator